MDKHLRIILELVSSGFTSGARGAGAAFKGFIGGIVDGAKSAMQSLTSLAQSIFFVREALNTLGQVASWVFSTFVKGAGDAAKFEVKLKALTGSVENAQQVMKHLRDVSTDTGVNFDELASGAQLLAVAAKDASGAFDFQKFKQMNEQLLRMAAVRPDVPIDRLARGLLAWMRGEFQSLEMFLDMPLRQMAGIEEAADKLKDLPKQIGQGVTYIETEVSQAASDAEANLASLEKALQEMGATSDLLEDMAEKSGLERLIQMWKEFTSNAGGPIFEALNKELNKLADWLEENPEKVDQIANMIGYLAAEGIEKLADAIEKIDWDKFAAEIDKVTTAITTGDWEGAKAALKDIADIVKVIADALQAIEAAGAWFEQANLDVGQAGADLGDVLGTSGIAPTVQEEGLRGLLMYPSRQLAGAAQRIIVELDLKNDMLDARIRQGADNAVTDGLTALSDEMTEDQQ